MRWRPWWVAVGLGVAVVGWTILLPVWRPIDERWLAPAVEPGGAWAWALEVFALVTAPWVVFCVLIVVAAWCWRVRLRRLAVAFALTALFARFGHLAFRAMIGRARPPTSLSESVSYVGSSYPSGHATHIAAAAAVGLVACAVLHVRYRWWAAVALPLVALVLLNRWAMSAHWASDLVGGVLFGSFAAAVAVAVAGAWPARVEVDDRRFAVVVHPGRVPPWLVKQLVDGRLRQAGRVGVTWFETSIADPGASGASTAGADRVLVAGGDGTVRAVASWVGAAELAILPVGSGDVLARNLRVPVDLSDAVALALSGVARRVDALSVRVGAVETIGLSMVGVGASARVLSSGSDGAKRLVRSWSYVLSGLRGLRPHPFAAAITADTERVEVDDAAEVIVLNAPGLRPGMAFAPDAWLDDGVIDVLVARPEGRSGALRMIGSVLRNRDDKGFQRATGSHVTIQLADPQPCHVDGDLLGEVTSVEVSVMPGALRIVAPGQLRTIAGALEKTPGARAIHRLTPD